MRWFGESWGAPVNELSERVETPVGQSCAWCDETIEAADSGVVMPGAKMADGEHRMVFVWVNYHRNCWMRQVLGSVGHQMGRCSCFGGDMEDPPGKSAREAANLAAAYYGL